MDAKATNAEQLKSDAQSPSQHKADQLIEQLVNVRQEQLDMLMEINRGISDIVELLKDIKEKLSVSKKPAENLN
jgi:hypothetical protein